MSVQGLGGSYGHANRGAESYRGGTRTHRLTAAMTTTAQLIKRGGGRLCQATSVTGASVGTVTYYDTPDTVANGVKLFTVTPGAVPVSIDIPFDDGLLVVASASVTGDILSGYV